MLTSIHCKAINYIIFTIIHCREKVSEGAEKCINDGSDNSHQSDRQCSVCESSSDYQQSNTSQQHVEQNQPRDCEQMVTENNQGKFYKGYRQLLFEYLVTVHPVK